MHHPVDNFCQGLFKVFSKVDERKREQLRQLRKETAGLCRNLTPYGEVIGQLTIESHALRSVAVSYRPAGAPPHHHGPGLGSFGSANARAGAVSRRCDGVALIPPIEPMLAEARRQLPPEQALPRNWTAEQKADGFRVILFARPGLIMLQSRQGADLTGAFPDIAAAATELSEALVLDGELVVPHEGRLHFAELQRRARRRGRSAIEAAAERPAYLIVFDVLETGGTELLARPYRERRAILEDLFARDELVAPFALCPATDDWATASDWLDPAWGTAGIEGVVIKGGEQPYLPGKRAWIKIRSRTTSEALVAGVTGALTAPSTLLLARYDALGRLRMIARTTALPTVVRRELARRLYPADLDHPWHGRRFSAGWGTRGELEYHTVRLDLVAEFGADTAVDDGVYRHPVRFLRLRDDLAVQQVPPFGT